MTPQRVQRSRQHKQVSPNGLPIVYCGRPGKFGNVFKVGKWVPWTNGMDYDREDVYKFHMKELTAEDCIYLFEKYQLPEMDLEPLRGKNLSCWCRLNSKCHLDSILKKLAQ